jgi:glycosyltransferase involved in cell wall biosynthesis
MPLLSVAIVTLNEEKSLARTLASVVWADEIVVVDSGSTDKTAEIARSFGAHVIEREWPGFAAQKNFAIAQCNGEWVLSLDADEELTPELQTEIQELFACGTTLDGFYLKRRNYFLGRWIRHGGFYPDAKLRLFRRNMENPALTPRFTERSVHETIAFDGKSGKLDFDLVHHAYPTLSGYIEHMNRYSSLGAEILATRGRTGNTWIGFMVNVLLAPHITFQWNYFSRLGFLDGREGLLLHLYHAAYTSWKYAKAWERTRGISTRTS